MASFALPVPRARIETGPVVTDAVTNLGEVELGEIAERTVEAQQRVDFAVPLVLVLACRERVAGQRPSGFHELFHVAQVAPGQRITAGPFDAVPGVLPEGSVPARSASIMPRDEK